MHKLNEHAAQARALLADIQASPEIILPRRETLVEWLNVFLLRAKAPAYRSNGTEAADLTDLEQYLRDLKMPAAAPAPATS